MITKNKKLAVIILNWNGLELLKEFIPTALQYTTGEDVDLIVADNGSSDDSCEWLKGNFPEIGLIEFEKNYGFAEGYNLAIAASDYPYIILLNSDVEVTEGWWQPLLKFMEETPEAGAVQPKIRSYRTKEYFEYAGAAGGYIDVNGYPYCRGRLMDKVEKDEGQYDGPAKEVCWASGAALMVRRQLYLDLGGLDPLFFAHMEEIDLCCRMWTKGYKVFALTDSVVYHVGGASLAQGNPKKTYLNFRNNLLLLYKNLPKQLGKKRIFKRMMIDSLAFMMYAVKLDFGNAAAIWKAHRDYKKLRCQYDGYSHPKEEICFPGMDRNIIIDRYLKGKNK